MRVAPLHYLCVKENTQARSEKLLFISLIVVLEIRVCVLVSFHLFLFSFHNRNFEVYSNTHIDTHIYVNKMQTESILRLAND